MAKSSGRIVSTRRRSPSAPRDRITATVCGYSLRRNEARISGSIWVRLAQTRRPEAPFTSAMITATCSGEDLEEQRLGALEARGDAAARREPRHEVDDQVLDDVGLERAELHHGVGDLLDLLLLQHPPDRRAVLLAEQQQQGGGRAACRASRRSRRPRRSGEQAASWSRPWGRLILGEVERGGSSGGHLGPGGRPRRSAVVDPGAQHLDGLGRVGLHDVDDALDRLGLDLAVDLGELDETPGLLSGITISVRAGDPAAPPEAPSTAITRPLPSLRTVTDPSASVCGSAATTRRRAAHHGHQHHDPEEEEHRHLGDAQHVLLGRLQNEARGRAPAAPARPGSRRSAGSPPRPGRRGPCRSPPPCAPAR